MKERDMWREVGRIVSVWLDTDIVESWFELEVFSETEKWRVLARNNELNLKIKS